MVTEKKQVCLLDSFALAHWVAWLNGLVNILGVISSCLWLFGEFLFKKYSILQIYALSQATASEYILRDLQIWLI